MKRNQRDRLYHTVTIRSGARLVLPKGTDPVGWIFKDVYSSLQERVLPLQTPLVEMLEKGNVISWGQS